MKQTILLAVLLATVEFAPSSTSMAARQQHGIAKFYGPGVMEAVARSRGYAHFGSYDGLASVPDCAYIGKIAVVTINGHRLERYFIVDCSQPRDHARHLRQKLIIEVDYHSAVRNHFRREGSAPATIISIADN